jgi:hypothetical protein
LLTTPPKIFNETRKIENCNAYRVKDDETVSTTNE